MSAAKNTLFAGIDEKRVMQPEGRTVTVDIKERFFFNDSEDDSAIIQSYFLSRTSRLGKK